MEPIGSFAKPWTECAPSIDRLCGAQASRHIKTVVRACNCARMACVRHNVFKICQDMHGGKSWEMHLVYKFGSSPEQTLLTSHCQGSGKLRDLA